MARQDQVETVRTALFKTLTRSQAEEILAATTPLAVPPGGFILREGDEGTGLFLLLKGRVEILKQDRDGTPQQIAIVEAPTVLGEMSLLTDSRHSATIRALTSCELRLLDKQTFRRLLRGDHLGAYKLVSTIAEVLASRLLRMDEKVLELLRQREGSAPVEELARFKQKLFSEWSF